MSTLAYPTDDRRRWAVAGVAALAAHAGAAVLVLAWSRPTQPPTPEPVVLVELPPVAVPAPVVADEPTPEPQPPTPIRPQSPPPPIPVPQTLAPLPSQALVLPPPAPPLLPREAAPPPPAPANPVPVGPTGADPKAKKLETDYFALISAHLNRRKVYPAEARKARQQGVVTVRFTVDRDGNVSGASIKRGSGSEILDRATLDLLQRVAPLPRMPASMTRDSVTLALPIDYSLRTN